MVPLPTFGIDDDGQKHAPRRQLLQNLRVHSRNEAHGTPRPRRTGLAIPLPFTLPILLLKGRIGVPTIDRESTTAFGIGAEVGRRRVLGIIGVDDPEAVVRSVHDESAGFATS